MTRNSSSGQLHLHGNMKAGLQEGSLGLVRKLYGTGAKSPACSRQRNQQKRPTAARKHAGRSSRIGCSRGWLQQRAEGRGLSTAQLRHKAKTLATKMNTVGFTGGSSWCFRFMRCNKLVHCRPPSCSGPARTVTYVAVVFSSWCTVV